MTCRCGCNKYVDRDIHGGRSVRRDCVACGHTLDFPRWDPPPERGPTLQKRLGTPVCTARTVLPRVARSRDTHRLSTF